MALGYALGETTTRVRRFFPTTLVGHPPTGYSPKQQLTYGGRAERPSRQRRWTDGEGAGRAGARRDEGGHSPNEGVLHRTSTGLGATEARTYMRLRATGTVAVETNPTFIAAGGDPADLPHSGGSHGPGGINGSLRMSIRTLDGAGHQQEAWTVLAEDFSNTWIKVQQINQGDFRASRTGISGSHHCVSSDYSCAGPSNDCFAYGHDLVSSRTLELEMVRLALLDRKHRPRATRRRPSEIPPALALETAGNLETMARHLRTVAWLGLALALLPGAARAQVWAGNEITAGVHVDSVGFAAGSTVVLFRVAVDSASQTAFTTLYVEAEPRLTRADPPAGEEVGYWYTTTTPHELDGGYWGSLHHVEQGDSTGKLSLEGVGYPGIVNRWIVGEVTMLKAPQDDTLPLPEYPDLFTEASVAGKTVGVVNLPADTTAAGLLDRLATLATEACGTLAWVPDTTTCTSISTDIADADAAAAASDPTTADAELAAVLTTLGTALGNGDATSLGYWLLRSNIEIICGKL